MTLISPVDVTYLTHIFYMIFKKKLYVAALLSLCYATAHYEALRESVQEVVSQTICNYFSWEMS